MSWSAIQTEILERFADVCPVAEELRAYDSFNAAFSPPTIDVGAPEAAVWIRPTINPFPSTSRPFGLAENANNWHEGQVVLQIFYPKGTGEAYLDAIVDAAVLIFHRQYLTTVHFRDSQPPLRVPPDSDDAAFAQINVVTPYVVIEVL